MFSILDILRNKTTLVVIIVLAVILFIVATVPARTRLTVFDNIFKSINGEYKETIANLESERSIYKNVITELNSKYVNLEHERESLLKEKNALKAKNEEYDKRLASIKSVEIKNPKDIYEASKILNSIGYDTTVTKCVLQ